MTLRDREFSSISELAGTLERKFEAVHRDTNYLSGFGFIKLKKHKKNVEPTLCKNMTFSFA